MLLVILTSKIVLFKEGGLNLKRNFIYAFWHRYQVLLAAYYRFRNIVVLVSRSKDGEIIATAIKLLGFKLVRGSSSKAPVRALVSMIRYIENGYVVAFTPDGPRGPIRDVKEGLITASIKTDTYIIPLAWFGNHFILNTWDRLMIPKPFGKFIIIEGAAFKATKKEEVYEKLVDVEKIAEKIWNQYF
ncbi:MAG: lysophospholipid acyltransferase family protein [bacterium]|nr:lysophospholipid acyltransferase family protein [bacterium]